ncbi:MAG: hypothetical protein M3340_11190 [Actinomycetota bacterium]|nr:hypothetical protein [Actinomycetota bacterium]
MSAYLYGSRTGTQAAGETPGLAAGTKRALRGAGVAVPKPSPREKLLTTLVGLIPADVLLLHAILLQGTTKVTENPETNKPVTEVTDPGTLDAGFWILCCLALFFYVVGRIRSGEPFVNKDIFLGLVPVAAFVGWAALQRGTAFDAVNASEGDRLLWGIVAAAVAVGFSLAFGGETEKGGDDAAA